MAPKKAAAAPKKAAATPSTHGSYKDMIKVAIVQLKDRMGSSRPAIKKYIQANNKLGSTTDEALSRHVNQAIASGVKSGDFVQPKGPSGTVKLAKKTADTPKPAAPAKKPSTKTAKKPAAKPAVKKTTTKKAPAATKTKANVAKSRKAPAKKTPSAAPAVETKKPVVLGKTKSGRVTKSSAPTPTVTKKAAPKKKAAAPKKAATPKAKA